MLTDHVVLWDSESDLAFTLLCLYHLFTWINKETCRNTYDGSNSSKLSSLTCFKHIFVKGKLPLFCFYLYFWRCLFFKTFLARQNSMKLCTQTLWNVYHHPPTPSNKKVLRIHHSTCRSRSDLQKNLLLWWLSFIIFNWVEGWKSALKRGFTSSITPYSASRFLYI